MKTKILLSTLLIFCTTSLFSQIIHVPGDQPTIQAGINAATDGDTVLVDQSQKNILAGAIFALGIEDTIMVKRVEKHPQKLVLRSDNRDYAPIYLEGNDANQVRILGKVIWVCREIR